MKWVLVYWIIAGTAAASSTAEFSSKEKCVAAAEAIFKASRYAQTTNLLGGNPQMQGNYICAEQ